MRDYFYLKSSIPLCLYQPVGFVCLLPPSLLDTWLLVWLTIVESNCLKSVTFSAISHSWMISDWLIIDKENLIQITDRYNSQSVMDEWVNFLLVGDHSGMARPTSYRQTRPQGVLQSAPGSRAAGPSPLTGRKSSVATDATDGNAVIISTKVYAWIP